MDIELDIEVFTCYLFYIFNSCLINKLKILGVMFVKKEKREYIFITQWGLLCG